MITSKFSNIPVTFQSSFPEGEDPEQQYDLQFYVGERSYVQKFSQARYESVRHNGIGWWEIEPQRARANNSAVFLRSKASKKIFVKFMERVKESRSGEPGHYWTNSLDWGTNPCVEIGLRPFQFCNLVTMNGGDVKDVEDFKKRCWAAAVIATLQAGYTDFHYLRNIWRKTTEKDALLGVSITGTASNVLDKDMLKIGAEIVKSTNETVANLIGIAAAARTTCIKPEGTTSLVLGTASGIHEWFAEHYVRRIRIGKNESIYNFLLSNLSEAKVGDYCLLESCVMRPHDTAVFTMPQKAPQNAIKRGQQSVIQQLERVKEYNENWVHNGHVDGVNSHNVSATIYLKDEEWDEAIKWMWKNKQFYNGLSILPFDGGTYKQTPFEAISPEVYEGMVELIEELDDEGVWDLNKCIELEDETDLTGEVACAGGACEL